MSEFDQDRQRAFAVAQVMQSPSAEKIEVIQSLWSGYGEIVRYRIAPSQSTVVVKWIQPPTEVNHPRGWNTSGSHQRKLKSYEVEAHWYAQWASRCSSQCRVPAFYGSRNQHGGAMLVFEDLDASGFSARRERLTPVGLRACLSWLAYFHGRWLGFEPDGLWPQGTYWHLQTRPQELAKMPDGPLKRSAHVLDQRLDQAQFKTLIHGDAKIANFCFTPDESEVAALDFQYVGGGAGVKDLCYFLGSCLSSQECLDLEAECLEYYFAQLQKACALSGPDFRALEQEWRALYSIAVADFARFLEGWQPAHRKLNSYTHAHVQRALSACTPAH
jgi:hypothetical protein